MNLDQVELQLDCGARVYLRVVVDTADCRRRDGACMTAAEIAGAIWMALQEQPAPAPRAS